MFNVLKRINLLKNVFREFRFKINTNLKKYKINYFNIDKIYMLQYYSSQIKKYNNFVYFNFDKNENMHINVKFDYQRINKHNNFSKQLFYHNERRLNIKTINDLFLYDNIKILNSIDDKLIIKIIIVFKSRK